MRRGIRPHCSPAMMRLYVTKPERPGKDISFNFAQREEPRPGDVYSFVLRVRFDPPPGGKGMARPVFYLENVGARQDKWLTHFDEVIKLLSDWVEAILDNTPSDNTASNSTAGNKSR